MIHLALSAAKDAGADEQILDGLLALCPDAECIYCSRIICPWSEPLHFHHDGCPQCSEHDEAVSAI